MKKIRAWISRRKAEIQLWWEADPDRRFALPIIGGAIAILIALVVGIILLINVIGGAIGKNSDTTVVAKESPTTAQTCSADFTQLPLGDNPEHQIVVGGIGDNGRPAQEKVDYVLEYARHRAPILHGYALSSLPEYKKAGVNKEDLVDTTNNCLSETGKKWFYRLEGAWKAKTAENGEAPAGYTNTGMNGDTFVANETPGINGDRSAVIITFTDGSKLYLLDRCGNVALPEAPKDIPKGKTDNPLTPKSDNPADYRQPGDNGKGADVGTGVKPQSINDGVRTPVNVPSYVGNTNRQGGTPSTSTDKPGTPGAGTAPGANSGTSNGGTSSAPPAQTGGSGANGSGGTGGQAGTGNGGSGASNTTQDPNLID